MISHFEILSKIEYSKFKIKYIIVDKNNQCLVRDNANQKIGIIFTLNEDHSLKEKEENQFRKNYYTEKKKCELK